MKFINLIIICCFVIIVTADSSNWKQDPDLINFIEIYKSWRLYAKSSETINDGRIFNTVKFSNHLQEIITKNFDLDSKKISYLQDQTEKIIINNHILAYLDVKIIRNQITCDEHLKIVIDLENKFEIDYDRLHITFIQCSNSLKHFLKNKTVRNQINLVDSRGLTPLEIFQNKLYEKKIRIKNLLSDLNNIKHNSDITCCMTQTINEEIITMTRSLYNIEEMIEILKSHKNFLNLENLIYFW
ncbi:hypothetical protein QLL95_gp0875 [Cotonvirus japonicus]|uniref:Uncharacterized protein n=1 Tax=Cotonvirus japonicus TaxID=2811091 RepID=A0ABM7NSV0_9VIRU|nr:hypothetical protein QLL95_gp0875 [Cotonvirus japonicus]BCS83248.1 hypothetical protein [Cotonvirus japonicus]